MNRCASCNAPIEWAETVNGHRIPLDEGEAENGNIVLQGTLDGRLITHVVAKGKGNRISHFATCPRASEHRRSA